MAESMTFAEFERRGWDEVAEGYVAAIDGMTDQAVEPLLDAVAARAGQRILDVATGGGALLEAGVRRGATMVGVDVTSAMLTMAAARCPSADLRLGAAESLPLEDASVDAVVSAYGMPHFADPIRFFHEARRALRVGGRLAFATWAPPPANLHIALMMSTLARFANLDIGLPAGPDMFRYANVETCREDMSAAGFSDVSLMALDTVWSGTGGADQLLDTVERGAVRSRAIWLAQTDEVRAAVRAALQEALVPHRGDDGVYRIPAGSVLVSAVAR